MTVKQVILMGLPGVGVEAQARQMAERWRVPYIALGALVQGAIASGAALELEVSPDGEAGAPLPDALAMKLLRRRLEQPDAMLNGWVLTGFPQTLTQAQALDDWLAKVGLPAAAAVYLKAMIGLLINRLWAAGGQAEPVPAIRQRLELLEAETAPILDYYQQRSQLTTLNGSLTFAEVAHALQQLEQTGAGAAPLIHDEAELDSLLADESLLVVDGMASWCGPCKLVTPLIDQLAEAYGDRVKVMKMDFDANQQIPKRFGLKGMPAVLFFKNGQLQETLTGVKPYQTYSATVSRFLE